MSKSISWKLASIIRIVLNQRGRCLNYSKGLKFRRALFAQALIKVDYSSSFFRQKACFRQFIYWTWIWHVRSSFFFFIILKKIHGNSHSEEEEWRWINGGALSKKGYTWQDHLEDHSLHWIWGQWGHQGHHHHRGPVSKTADILHCLQINQVCQQQVIKKGCLVFAKTSTEPYWPTHHGFFRWIGWKFRRPWMKNVKSLFHRAKLF